MRSLLPRERKFVLSLVARGRTRGSHSAAAADAGYSTTNANVLKVQAHTIFHRPRVQAAIHEVAQQMLGNGKIEAVGVIREIFSDPDVPPAVRRQAAMDYLSLGGIAPKTEHKITVERVQSEAEKVNEIIRMCDTLGWGEDKKRELLGSAMPPKVIDVTPNDQPES